MTLLSHLAKRCSPSFTTLAPAAIRVGLRHDFCVQMHTYDGSDVGRRSCPQEDPGGLAGRDIVPLERSKRGLIPEKTTATCGGLLSK